MWWRKKLLPRKAVLVSPPISRGCPTLPLLANITSRFFLKRALLRIQRRIETSLFRNTSVICLLMINKVQTLSCAHTPIHTHARPSCNPCRPWGISPQIHLVEDDICPHPAVGCFLRTGSQLLQGYQGHLCNEQGAGLQGFQGPSQPWHISSRICTCHLGTWVRKRVGEAEERQDRGNHCFQANWNRTQCSRRQHPVIPACPLSSTPCVLQAPGAPGDHFSLSGFPVDMTWPPSLLLSFELELGVNFSKWVIIWALPSSTPKSLVPTQLASDIDQLPLRIEGQRKDCQNAPWFPSFREQGGLTALWILLVFLIFLTLGLLALIKSGNGLQWDPKADTSPISNIYTISLLLFNSCWAPSLAKVAQAEGAGTRSRRA